jgi:type IV fimbrial biogenesis protein FimT
MRIRLHGHSGFSLIELMVTIAIVAILLAVAFPSFEGSLRSNRMATASNELIASLSLARSEALRNPSGAVICTSDDGTSCGGDWNDGWIVWIDQDGDRVLDSEDRVVRHVVSNDRLVLAAAATPAGNPLMFAFDPRGRVEDGNQRTIALEPDTCPTDVELVRTLRIMPTGQVQMQKGVCP